MTRVYYHDDLDGFTAAWVHGRFNDGATYVPFRYGCEIQFQPKEDLVFLDCKPDNALLQEMVDLDCTVKAIDHHVDFDPAPDEVVSVRHGKGVSGCMAAWLHYGSGESEEDAPPIVRYVQDRDLWKWELPNSRQVNAVLSVKPKTFSTWSGLNGRFELKGSMGFCSEGQMVELTKLWVANETKVHMREFTILGHEALIVNVPVLTAEVGELIYEGNPQVVFVGWGVIGRDVDAPKIKIELRSAKEGPDVSLIAKHMGGGGHEQAAGFVMSIGDGFRFIEEHMR